MNLREQAIDRLFLIGEGPLTTFESLCVEVLIETLYQGNLSDEDCQTILDWQGPSPVAEASIIEAMVNQELAEQYSPEDIG